MKQLKFTIALLLFVAIAHPALSQTCDSLSFAFSPRKVKRINDKEVVDIKSKYCINRLNTESGCLLKGFLLDRVSRKPIESASIHISNEHGTITKADGSFQLQVPPGKHQVHIGMVGYAAFNTQSILFDEGQIIQLFVFLGPSYT